jgi:hypothetical protein
MRRVAKKRNLVGISEMQKNAKPKVGRPSAKPGPKPQVLKIHGNWQAAMRKSLKEKKPPGGWPK